MIWQWMKDKKPLPAYLKRREEGNVTIAYGKSLEICYLNRTGGEILSLCDGKRSLGDIERVMLSKFSVEPEVLQNDLVEIVRDLQWKRLLILEE